MTALHWEEGPLGKHLDRNAFHCSEDDLAPASLVLPFATVIKVLKHGN